MKRKSSKKKSNKKETEENSRYVTGFVVDEKYEKMEELKINWKGFEDFFNSTLER